MQAWVLCSGGQDGHSLPPQVDAKREWRPFFLQFYVILIFYFLFDVGPRRMCLAFHCFSSFPCGLQRTASDSLDVLASVDHFVFEMFELLRVRLFGHVLARMFALSCFGFFRDEFVDFC